MSLTEDRFVNGSGYVLIKDPTHPLAGTKGYVREHRKVLYDAIGPGEHPCHWCGTTLAWRQGGSGGNSLCVDHVDGDRQNNDVANLRATCIGCNTLRTSPKIDVEPEPVDETPAERSRRRNRERQAKHRARKRAQLDPSA